MKKLIATAFTAAFASALMAAPTIRIMPVGDSITEGACGTKSGYRYFLERDLTADGYSIDYVGDNQANPCDELQDKDHSGHSGWYLASEGAAYSLSIQDQIGGWLDALGENKPDVILLHAGTNDSQRQVPLTYLPDALRAILATVSEKSPTTHVIVTTVLERRDTTHWTGAVNWDKNINDNFNAAIPGIVAEDTTGKVHFLDMRAKLTQPGDFDADALHPNDSGYQKMSDAWRKAIKKVFPAAQYSDKPEELTPRPWTEADYLAEKGCYSLVYEFTPVWEIDEGNPASIYSVNKAAEFTGTTFDRVAYEMELQKPGADKQFVWVSFEAPTDDLTKIGLPYDYERKGAVQTMNVFSNVADVDNGAYQTGGKLEFWNDGYGDGGDGLFDDADVQGGVPTFGSMQIHNSETHKTIFSYSAWHFSSFQAALGIGTCPVAQRQNSDPDWTFAQNVNQFELKTIKVYAHLATDPAIPVVEEEEDEPPTGGGEGGGSSSGDTPTGPAADEPGAEPVEPTLDVESAGLLLIRQANPMPLTEVADGKALRVDALTTENAKILKDGAGTLDLGAVAAMGNAADYDPNQNKYGYDFVAGGPDVTIYDGEVKVGAPVAIDLTAITTTPFLHLDASNADTLTTETDGQGRARVKTWKDPVTMREATGGFSKHFENGEDRTMPLPFLVENALNGKPVVDFGRYVEAQNGQRPDGQWWCLSDYDLSESGTLKIPDTGVRELFMIVKTNERRHQPFYLGSEYGWVYSFSTGAYGTMGWSACGDLANGETRVDGVLVRADNYVPDQEYHLVALSPTGVVGGLNTLTLDRHCRIGGMALAELVAYSDPLSVEERRAVEAYLMEKWLGKSHPMVGPVALGNLDYAAEVPQKLCAERDAAVGVINATGTFVKSGAGHVTATGLSESITGFTVTGGSLAFAGAGNALDVLNEATFHIDPSVESTLVKTEDGERVTRINDVRASSTRYAETSAQSKAVGPSIKTYSATNLPMLDFGAFSYNEAGEADDTCGMKWNERAEVYTFCMVVEKKAYDHDSFVLGDWYNYDFHGDSGTLLNPAYASYLVKPGSDTQAKWTVDGKAVADPLSAMWDVGPHVITMTLLDRNPNNGVKNGAPMAGMFAQDRELCRIGGLRYGEVVVFNKTISDAKVKAISSYLMEKWLGSEKNLSGGMKHLEVAAGSSFSYEGDLIIGTGAEIALGYRKNGSGVINVQGEVLLGKDIALTIGSKSNPPKDKIPVIRATSLGEGADAAIKTWTLNGDKMRYTIEGGTVYANCGSPGLVVIIK